MQPGESDESMRHKLTSLSTERQEIDSRVRCVVGGIARRVEAIRRGRLAA